MENYKRVAGTWGEKRGGKFKALGLNQTNHNAILTVTGLYVAQKLFLNHRVISSDAANEINILLVAGHHPSFKTVPLYLTAHFKNDGAGSI